jgi:carboxypeptidase C (cathepsin A)
MALVAAAFFLLGSLQTNTAEVTSLPGWAGKLPSRSWSGFVDGTPPGEKKPIHTHYWLFESEGDPQNDPLIVWTNGGPGASSMFGLLVELGPFYLSGASLLTAEYNATGIPTLFRNDFSWTKLGNLLIYNAPAPVGYSFCGDDPAGDAHSCGAWDDTRQAKSAHRFLKQILKQYPQFAEHDLYITGESYAGICASHRPRPLRSTSQRTARGSRSCIPSSIASPSSHAASVPTPHLLSRAPTPVCPRPNGARLSA